MHILVVPSEHFVTEKVPLGGIFQLEQARALSRAGYQVGVIAVGLLSPRYFVGGYPYSAFELLDGLPVHRSYAKNFLPHRYYPVALLQARYFRLFDRLFKRYVQRHGRPDVLHAHNSLYAGVLARKMSKQYGIPYVITEHSSAFARGMVPQRMDRMLMDVFDHAGALSCVSSTFKHELETRFGRPFSVLHNLVDAAFFRSDLSGNRTGHFRFISVASLDDNKNLALALRGFASLPRNTGASFAIVGEGPLRGELTQLCQQLGIGARVQFLGRLSRDEVRNAMQSADCLVLSSYYETFGVVLIEAMASGLPVIATRCGGPNDIVTAENGLLVTPGDQGEIEFAMQLMLERSHSFDAQVLRAQAMARFGEGAFVRDAVALYSRALSPGGQGHADR